MARLVPSKNFRLQKQAKSTLTRKNKKYSEQNKNMQDLIKIKVKTDKNHIICKKTCNIVHSDNKTVYFLSFLTKTSKNGLQHWSKSCLKIDLPKVRMWDIIS